MEELEKKHKRKKTTRKRSQTQATNNVSHKKLKLLVTVVDRAKGEFFADFIQSFDVNMQMLCFGRGTAKAEMLSYLGLNDSHKTVIFSVIREDKVVDALNALEEKFSTIKNGKGIAFSVPMSSIIGAAIYGFLSNNRLTVKEDKQ